MWFSEQPILRGQQMTQSHAIAAAIFTLALIVPLELFAQAASGKLPPRQTLIERKSMAIADDEPDLSRLLKLRFNACLEETRGKFGRYLGTRVTLEDLLESGKRLSGAAVEAATTSEQQTAAYEEYVSFCRDVERIVRDKVEENNEPTIALHQAQYYRYDAEILLYRARTASKTR
jgi:hypothetical protein